MVQIGPKRSSRAPDGSAQFFANSIEQTILHNISKNKIFYYAYFFGLDTLITGCEASTDTGIIWKDTNIIGDTISSNDITNKPNCHQKCFETEACEGKVIKNSIRATSFSYKYLYPGNIRHVLSYSQSNGFNRILPYSAGKIEKQ